MTHVLMSPTHTLETHIMPTFPYDQNLVLAVFMVRNSTHHDPEGTLVDTYTVVEIPNTDGTDWGFVVMRDGTSGHGQITPTLAADAAMSYALTQCGWGDLETVDRKFLPSQYERVMDGICWTPR